MSTAKLHVSLQFLWTCPSSGPHGVTGLWQSPAGLRDRLADCPLIPLGTYVLKPPDKLNVQIFSVSNTLSDDTDQRH